MSQKHQGESVDDVIITRELRRRPSREADYEAEAKALRTLAAELAERPDNVLQKLTDSIVDLGIAGSAGISLQEGDRFRWDAISGAWAHLRGEGMPFDASPCGIVLTRNEMLLLRSPERLFPGNDIDPLIRETLLVPFQADGKPVGTLWILAHDERKFDREDARLLQSLAGFASAAYQTVKALGDARAGEHRVQEINETLRRREHHLQSILATVPEAMIVIDEQGLMTSFSAAAERLFGYSEQEVLGCNVSMLMPSPYREQHDGYLERYKQTGERRIIGKGRVVTARRKDGSDFPIELAVGEALTDQQRIFTGFIRDLTERQETEARLQELQSELIHASRLSAMGTMASTLAHELNQPLTAVANYVSTGRDLLQGAVDFAEVREILTEALDEAAEQSVRAGQIVRRLRDFVSRGETEKRIEPLRKLVEEANALALVGAREKGVTVKVFADPDASEVLADRVQIQQVLVNLLRNAIEAMDGCPRKELCIETKALGPDQTEVIVADTGPGLAPQVAQQLFQPFVSTKSQGMGLGLSISRTIIEAHGGSLRAEKNGDGGTTFRFTLPRVSNGDVNGG